MVRHGITINIKFLFAKVNMNDEIQTKVHKKWSQQIMVHSHNNKIK